jgi:hypothetical protein
MDDRPFDFKHPSPLELEPFLGDNWVIHRRTPRIVAKYGPDVNCITPKEYSRAVRNAVAARGYARPVENTIHGLLAAIEALRRPIVPGDSDFHKRNTYEINPAIAAAESILTIARKP